MGVKDYLQRGQVNSTFPSRHKQPNRGISVITPLPLGEGTGEGPAGDSGQLGSVVCSAAPPYLNSCTAYGAPEVFTLRVS